MGITSIILSKQISNSSQYNSRYERNIFFLDSTVEETGTNSSDMNENRNYKYLFR